MDEQPIPPAQPSPAPEGTAWTQTPPPAYAAPPVTDAGLSDTAAGALAYVTIIPAILFLVLAPYNTRPFVKFHAFQCIGLSLVWFCLSLIFIIPILGWIVGGLGYLALVVCWILSIMKASQGSAFRLPVISEFAAKQSGYVQ
jgi:uncharacterized membrane protein